MTPWWQGYSVGIFVAFGIRLVVDISVNEFRYRRDLRASRKVPR
jgi:hypothetical protein